jgi:hypothetical protein
LGHLGWTEREYYESSPESVYYAIQGYFDKMKIEENWFRTLGWISYKVGGGKEKSISKFWYIEGDKPINDSRSRLGSTPEEVKASIEKIKKAHNIK